MTSGEFLDSIPGWVWALIPVEVFALMIWAEWTKAKRRRARDEGKM